MLEIIFGILLLIDILIGVKLLLILQEEVNQNTKIIELLYETNESNEEITEMLSKLKQNKIKGGNSNG